MQAPNHAIKTIYAIYAIFVLVILIRSIFIC